MIIGLLYEFIEFKLKLLDLDLEEWCHFVFTTSANEKAEQHQSEQVWASLCDKQFSNI